MRIGKVVSCALVMVNARREVFACHTTGTPRWDLPKGVQDSGLARLPLPHELHASRHRLANT